MWFGTSISLHSNLRCERSHVFSIMCFRLGRAYISICMGTRSCALSSVCVCVFLFVNVWRVVMGTCYGAGPQVGVAAGADGGEC